ncbi:uncharacterized protein [Nicotiana sylvestris]|uniref:uncharacterized protein n=1 Tax=Nicotiana sylvestris TaxID=4096 RepID=UPI00388CA335
MVEELKKLTSRVQGVEGGKGIKGLNYEDLCIQPYVELSEGYKPPKFKMFDEKGDPKNLKKKPTETFREYGTRWRSEAAKVKPALNEEWINKFFVWAHDPQYYERLMVIENHKFSDIIKFGERIEEGIKSGMMTNFEALQATNKALQSSGISKKKEKPQPNFDRKPLRKYTTIAEPIDQMYERLKAAGYVTPIPVVAMENSSQWVNPNKTYAYHSNMKGHTIDECRILKDKIQTLIDNKVMQAKEAAPNVRNNPLPYHRGEGINVIETDEEWDTDGSIRLIKEGDDPKKPIVTLNPIMVQVYPPIEVEVTALVLFELEITSPIATPIPFEVEVDTPFTVTVVTTLPFKSNAIPWDYVAEARRKGKAKMEESSATQGMTRTGRIYTPENLGGSSKEAATKQPVIETGPDNLWRKVQAREYSVINHLNKTPAQISILSLLQNSEVHKNALIKVLNEVCVPNNITSGEMANMVGQVLESHKITFYKDELPPEGLSHNRALHIMMGPTWFDVEFQVLDISAIYNLLLGRPWMHAAGAVASTLHQDVKFEWNHQKKDKWWSKKIESILAWSGYESGKGLGKKLQGITKPIQLKHGTTFGLRYPYTWQEYDDWSPPWHGPYYPLEQPVLHLSQTFHQADTIWGSAEEEALVGLRNLFLEDENMDCNVIIEEDEEEGLTIQIVEKGAVLKN